MTVSISSLAKTILLNHICRFYPPNTLPIGRPRSLSFSYILDRILFVLSSGCQWSHLPVFNGSWKTVHHYFSLWSKHHLFQHAYNDLLRVYLKIRPRSSTRVVDTSFVKNVFGRDCVGPSPFDRGRNATKVSTITDHTGVSSSLPVIKSTLIKSTTLLTVVTSFLISPLLIVSPRNDNKHLRKITASGSLLSTPSVGWISTDALFSATTHIFIPSVAFITWPPVISLGIDFLRHESCATSYLCSTTTFSGFMSLDHLGY
jgi:hypothetical protein